jgi:hypothetical protein
MTRQRKPITEPTALTAKLQPLVIRLGEAIRFSGFSRSDLYRRAARGEVIFLKAGARVLVDLHSLRAAVEALPKANLKPTLIESDTVSAKLSTQLRGRGRPRKTLP